MLRQMISVLVLGLLLWAGWEAWQPPSVTNASRAAVQALPERPGDASELWRVVTRRMIVSKSAEAMGKSMLERGLPAMSLEHQEDVELHAFDDPRTFKVRDDAVRARNEWRKAGFDAELIKPDERFGVALGRLYLEAYAQQMQRRLEKANRPYTYERRQLHISTWRFTFAPAPYAEARELWTRVQALGVADPVLMRESRFRTMFADFPVDAPAP
ncbi:MAG: hypothetical protein COW19_06390 [Zetaproteobacteria bacterium CG12_big_fil_rev_8_21_14_0_65_55_1124]|nr:MAG: hypothetical protein AUJ58_01595 [Zetaproteobacteria bacterium CG1_02_55_237]PIS18830.1 MAG: hypothetical protein COT53_08685 [Zetaproteobacteria bacterium CG08_land_8_20_14_0_20_55_17]PIW42749.1 MAG: hypothetical protein COW19_06390 [Zetaproteobacteria bacterium CG12_big_fil_rev_8_21_14_0_65_55_1124]PIZ40027.1 MAG: hypothetical protein COY36_00845 [Zetaproteobacteria bacterium CG_4_10_14_0_2_um_filter_55_20]PJB82734.1 MAG: hypothetical protein CO089_00640 [Zetaproteobacteria bacterium 